MLKKDVPIARFGLGIDQLTDETSLKNTARDMLNVDVFTSGDFGRRRGFTKLSAFTGGHSLWGSRDGSFGLYVRDDTLRRIVVRGGTPMSATVLSGLALNAPMSYFEYADQVLFTNGAQLGLMTRTSARLLGIDVPGAPLLTALSSGALQAGRYSIALSCVLASGEESGLSEITTLAGVQGGITVALPTPPGVARIRIYSTPANGDVLYQVAEVPSGLTSYDVTDLPLGKQADTQYLRRMPAGQLVRAFNGRAVVARDDALWFSEPFNYGLVSPRHGFVRFNSPITAFEPVAGGLFVSTSEAVYFLAGGGPNAFQQRVVSFNAAGARASTLVPASQLPGKLPDRGADPAAMWLGAAGYSVGLSDGTALDLNADRLGLSSIAARYGAVFTVSNGLSQTLSIVESTEPLAPGVAVDSVI